LLAFEHLEVLAEELLIGAEKGSLSAFKRDLFSKERDRYDGRSIALAPAKMPSSIATSRSSPFPLGSLFVMARR
jgi:hypothetical protein